MSDIDLKLRVASGKLALEPMSFKGSIWLLCQLPGAWSEENQRLVPVDIDVSEGRRLCALAMKAGLQVVQKANPRH